MVRKVLTDNQEIEVASLYSSGKTMSTLSEKYNCSRSAISNALRRQGIKNRSRKPAAFIGDFQVSQIVKLYVEGGLSAEAIGRQLDVRGDRIRLELRRKGIQPRKRYATGSKHGLWKGGRRVDKQSGYVWIRSSPEDPSYIWQMTNGNGNVQEHRYVMALFLDRKLESYESVHHINDDKTDNRLDNLQLRMGNHGKGIAMRCRCCGSNDIEAIPLQLRESQ